MGVHCQEQQQQKTKEGNERTNGTEFITVSVLFTCRYFTHKDFFFFFISLHWQLSVTSAN